MRLSQSKQKLFQSDFNEWMAIYYLDRETDESVISYLCERMRKFPQVVFFDFLFQLMHILFRTLNKEIEMLLVEKCLKSTHLAVRATWIVQCYEVESRIKMNALLNNLCVRLIQQLSKMEDYLEPTLEDLLKGSAFSPNYYGSELQLFAAFSQISDRLLQVSSDLRHSTLCGEIALLNHNFPANICVPFVCNGQKCKHKIVRIIPEAVLDSAERVPYMIHVEVHMYEAIQSEFLEISPFGKHRRSSTIKVCRNDDGFEEQMRTAAVLLCQLAKQETPKKRNHTEQIRQKVIKEMELLQEKRQIKMVEVEIQDIETSFAKEWESKKQKIRQSSPFGLEKNWNLYSVIIKNGADLRQEQLAYQLTLMFRQLWLEAGVACWVYPYHVMVTGPTSGIIEAVKNTISMHSLKKKTQNLRDTFIALFGPSDQEPFQKAQENFMASLAGYSLLTWVLNVKDRHNGNILFDYKTGHIVHIDFGFMLNSSPGSVGFETSPFKFPYEYLDLLDGLNSELYMAFRSLLCSGFMVLRRAHEKIIGIIEIMEKNSSLPCFQDNASQLLRERLQTSIPENQVPAFLDKLISSSLGNVFTRLYDSFQYYSQGINS